MLKLEILVLEILMLKVLKLKLLVLKKLVLELPILGILRSIFIISACIKDASTGNIYTKSFSYV